MVKTAEIIRFMRCGVSLCAGLILLSACAPSAEFQAVPQKGAWRDGAYPSFSAKPQAEGAQFSEKDEERLTRGLRAEGQRARAVAYAEEQKQKAEPDSDSAKKQAGQEIEDTLRQIGGGN